MQMRDYDVFRSVCGDALTVIAITTPDHIFTNEANSDNSLKIILVRVDEIPSSGFPMQRDVISFKLDFVSGMELPQGTYRMNHARIGDVEMFLVPRGPAHDGFHLIATFN